MAQQQVTDPKEIERLNALFGAQSQQVSNSNSVTDPSLINALNEQYRLQNAQQGVSPAVKETKEPSSSKEDNIISKLYAQFEVPLSIASSAAAGVGGGLAGMYGIMSSGDIDTAIRELEATQGALTYTPKTQQAQDILSTLGETLAPVGQAFESVSKGLGDIAFEATGSPLAGAAAYTIPTAIGEVLGLRGIKASRNFNISNPKIDAEIRTILEHPLNRFNYQFAFVKIDPKTGKIVPDQTAIDLGETGFNRGSIPVITKTTPENKQIMARMLDAFEASSENDIYKATKPAASEIGTSVLRRLNILKANRTSLGRDLDNLVEGDAGKLEVNVQPAISSFMADLFKQFGVKAHINSKGVIQIKSEGKLSEFPTLKTLAERTVSLYNKSTLNGVSSVKEAHQYKKLLDELENVDKAAQGGITGTMHRNLLGLRQNINNTIRDASSDYARINDNLSKTIQTMRPWEDLLEPGQRWDSDLNKNMIESNLNSLGKDSQKAQKVTDAIVSLEKSMGDMGYDLKDNPVVLLEFKRILEDNFSVNMEELAGRIGKQDAPILSKLTDLGLSLSLGNKFAASHDVASLVKLGMKKSEAEALLENKQKVRELVRKALMEQ